MSELRSDGQGGALSHKDVKGGIFSDKCYKTFWIYLWLRNSGTSGDVARGFRHVTRGGSRSRPSPAAGSGRGDEVRQLGLRPEPGCVILAPVAMWPAAFGTLRGVVHDPDHRPVQGADVVVKSGNSDYARNLAA